MHFPIDAIPENTEFGDFAVSYSQYPKGIDVDALLKGLPNDMCPCPHWGYVTEGAIKLKYADGSEETISAGDVYYMPADHTAEVLEDCAMLEFSPKKEYYEVMAHVEKRMEEMQ